MNRWHLQISGTNLAYTVRINDIVIFSDRWQTSRSDGCPINQWLVSGMNRLQVNLGVGLSKDSAEAESACLVQVKEIALDNPSAPENIAAEINLVFKDGELSLPFDRTVEFPVPDLDPSRWEQGDKFDPENPDLSGLVDFLAAIQNQMEAKDIEGIVGTMRIKSEEMARAFGMPIEERLKDQREFFEELFQISDWGMLPFEPQKEPQKIFTQIEGEGRLLKVTDQVGGPILKSKEFEDGSNFGLRFHLSRHKDRWEVAR